MKDQMEETANAAAVIESVQLEQMSTFVSFGDSAIVSIPMGTGSSHERSDKL
jgi:hypothetical protein